MKSLQYERRECGGSIAASHWLENRKGELRDIKERFESSRTGGWLYFPQIPEGFQVGARMGRWM